MLGSLQEPSPSQQMFIMQMLAGLPIEDLETMMLHHLMHPPRFQHPQLALTQIPFIQAHTAHS